MMNTEDERFDKFREFLEKRWDRIHSEGKGEHTMDKTYLEMAKDALGDTRTEDNALVMATIAQAEMLERIATALEKMASNQEQSMKWQVGDHDLPRDEAQDWDDNYNYAASDFAYDVAREDRFSR